MGYKLPFCDQATKGVWISIEEQQTKINGCVTNGSSNKQK
jgi:hypothetical protein